MAQQGKDDGYQVRRRVQPVEGRARGGREGATAGLAAITLFHLAMHHDIALPQLSSGTASGIVTELGPRVHRWPPSVAILQSRAITSIRMPEGPAFFQAIIHSPRFSGVIPNATTTKEESFRRQYGAVRFSLAVAIHSPSGSVGLAEPGSPATLFRLRGT
jgi:hypothetical protein